MSKAFTKEDDNQDDDFIDEDDSKILVTGGKNYITPWGAQKLRDELTRLLDVERPEVVKVVQWAASNGDRSENADHIYGKRRLREIDRRLRFLTKRLDAAEIVNPQEQKSDKVLFGATVTIRNESGTEKTYRIVGVDEIDASRGHISWISPVGKALLQTKVGDFVTVHLPKGEEEFEVVKLTYEVFS